MTTNEGIAIGAVVIGGAFLVYVMSQNQKKLLATSSGSSLAGVGGLLSGVGSFIKSISNGNSGQPPAAYSSLSTPNGVSPVDTATSNYLADITATSDTESGVVGFGGWL
jgi:hypothetical protein